jgi:hypothetical protein
MFGAKSLDIEPVSFIGAHVVSVFASLSFSGYAKPAPAAM